MSVTILFPDSVKRSLKAIAIKNNYPVAVEVLNRGGDGELILGSDDEAQVIVNVARVEMLNALLKYPYWDEDSEKYDPSHESAFQDIQMRLFEKTVMYIGAEFKIVNVV